MADSKRQRIVDAVVARMQQIRTANGYLTESGTKVFEWQTNFQDDELDPIGVISVCDMPAEAAQAEGSNPRQTVWLMPLQIRFYARRGTSPANIRTVGQDIQRAIRQDDRWIVDNVGLAMSTRPVREGFLIPEDSFEVIGGVVEVEVQFFTQKFNAEA